MMKLWEERDKDEVRQKDKTRKIDKKGRGGA